MAYKPSASPALGLWARLGSTRAGRWLVSRAICFVAPYFGTIRPVFTTLQPGHVELVFRKRRAVQNHLKSVHAIAMCNAAELAAGTCLDVSLHGDFRWIPVGMEVSYLKMAKTDLTAVCRIDKYDWEESRDVTMPVGVFDTSGEEVFHADIRMRISPKNK
jgi:acyl-coenzyme A thioesterase PaaI-like protein